MNFTRESLANRVVFAPGALTRLPDEVERLGLRHVLVLCTPGRRALGEEAAAALGERAVGVFDEARMHVPVATQQAALAEAARLGAEGTVAIGGGSTIGLGKALALAAELPIVAVPTTYSGSEMTPVWGLTQEGVKRTGRDPRVLPRTVLYDPRLTLELPPGTSATSGVNAMAHAAEALYAEGVDPITALMAEEGLRALAAGLPRVVAAPRDEAARAEALYGAWLCGACLGTVGMALHHKLCHTLGGTYGLPHAETHTVVLPHVLAFNAPAAPAAMRRMARALGGEDVAGAVFDLAEAMGAPTALRSLGLQEESLDEAAELATANAYANPRPVTAPALRALLDDAYHGRRPQVSESAPVRTSFATPSKGDNAYEPGT